MESTTTLSKHTARKPQWEQQSSKWRSELGVSPQFAPWTRRPEFQGLGVSGQKRVLDLLDCSWVHAYKRAKLNSSHAATRSGLADGLIVDTSQNHVRKPLSSADGFLRTLLTSSDLYHFGEDRAVLPVEHLFLQGYGEEVVVPKGSTPNDVRTLAGEAICLPCLATVLWCLHLTKDLTQI